VKAACVEATAAPASSARRRARSQSIATIPRRRKFAQELILHVPEAANADDHDLRPGRESMKLRS
jgi:hypothetical protein